MLYSGHQNKQYGDVPGDVPGDAPSSSFNLTSPQKK